MNINLNGNKYSLLPSKALYRHDIKSLFIADAHFGKVSHFRKSGIAVPHAVSNSNLQKLRELLEEVCPKSVFFLGDLFHSDSNNEWFRFLETIEEFKGVNFTLVKGNHDILPDKFYLNSNLSVVDEGLELEDLILTHHPMDEIPTEKVNLCGHIHPGVVLAGKGRQRIKLPAFLRQENQMILPAFGLFTGLFTDYTTNSVELYGILSEKVISISPSLISKKR